MVKIGAAKWPAGQQREYKGKKMVKSVINKIISANRVFRIVTAFKAGKKFSAQGIPTQDR